MVLRVNLWEMAGTSIRLAILEVNSLSSYFKMEEHTLGRLDLCTYKKRVEGKYS
jgi:hypothetical protein